MLTMPGSKDPEPTTDFAGRLDLAIKASGKSPSRVQREAGLQSGYIFKLLGRGEAKQISSPGPSVVRKLASYLGVSYEWLAIGRGPMRTEGWADSPLESATRFALLHGSRQDAIDAAVARYRDAADMTGNDWVLAFNAEAVRLDRAGVPRPEIIEAAQRKTRRLAEKKARQEVEIAELEEQKARRAADQKPLELVPLASSPPKRKRGKDR